MTVGILIVDNSRISRSGLRAFVEAQADWEVCGEARDGLEAI
jgi:DNA-binding NarL/FixJ family response regulator